MLSVCIKFGLGIVVPTVLPHDAINKNVTYLSSDPEVATVDENGVVTGLKGGTCEIIVTTEESSVKAVCTIVVREYVTSVEIEGSKEILNVGAELKLTPIVKISPTGYERLKLLCHLRFV